MVFFPRWVRSEWADVWPLDRLLCAIPASGVPPCQALCTGRLRSTRPGDGWSYAGWGGQGDALCPQRGETVLSPGMQVHPPADQLLSTLEGERQTERPGGRVRLLDQPIDVQSHSGDVSSLLSALSPERYKTCLSRSLREGQTAGRV